MGSCFKFITNCIIVKTRNWVKGLESENKELQEYSRKLKFKILTVEIEKQLQIISLILNQKESPEITSV